MHIHLLFPLLAFLGLQDRYWIIIIVILVILGIAYFVRRNQT